MEKLRIRGGTPLNGEIAASGSKNSALPILAASLLSDDEVCLRNIPQLRDVTTMMELLSRLGAHVRIDEGFGVALSTSNLMSLTAPYELVRTMRASFLVLGPLLARHGKVEVSLPGGCAIGTRPVDQHLMAFEKMGAHIDISEGYVFARCDGRLNGAHIVFDMPTVGGTQNVLMAATLARGTTTIENAAREPEVVELAKCLRAMGAKIYGEGTSVLTVDGQEQLKGCSYSVMSDRIEVGTYLIAAAATGGQIRIQGASRVVLEAVLDKLEEYGLDIEADESSIALTSRSNGLIATDICTDVYPGIPTDLQAQFLVLNCLAKGRSTVTETVFENRFMHVQELARLGANVYLEGSMKAIVEGVRRLKGAQVMATDLRASSCLVIAALVAEGETIVDRIYHIDRGYERIEEKLNSLGAEVERI